MKTGGPRLTMRWMVLMALFTLHSSLFTCEAQNVRFGFKGGLELTNMDFSSSALRDNNRTGFYIGPVLGITLPVVGLGIDVSLLYNQRSVKVDEESLTQKSMLVPANLRYGFGIGDELGIFLSGGPQLSFNIGDDIYYWKDALHNNHQYSLQNTMLSFNIGAGLHIGSHLEGGIYYNIPMGKTADFTWDQLGSELKDTSWNRAKSRTNAWHVAVAYYF